MPAEFLACVKANGKMVTKQLSGGRYIHGCKDAKGWHWGEIKEKKSGAFLEKR